jgi:hypothetical protein
MGTEPSAKFSSRFPTPGDARPVRALQSVSGEVQPDVSSPLQSLINASALQESRATEHGSKKTASIFKQM